MRLVDTNILVYAHAAGVPQHAKAKKWLDEQLNGSVLIGLPWHSLMGFIRIVSNPRVFTATTTVEQAWRQVELWLDCDPVWIPGPGTRHRAILGQFLCREANTPRLVSDAHLAALAIEHGLILCSTDGDFARFQGIRWENPLG